LLTLGFASAGFVKTGYNANISEIKSIHPQVQDAEAFFKEQFSK